MSATVSFAPSTTTQNEGNGGSTPVTYTILRSGDLSLTSTVNWAVTGGSGLATIAAIGADFVGGALPSGTVTFLPGQDSQSISFSIAGDTLVEPNESYTVSLSVPAGPTSLGFFSFVSGTIQNDDGAILSLLTGPSLNEGNSGSTAFNFTVTRSGDLGIAASADWAVVSSGFLTAADAGDFPGGILPSGTVSFAAGETSKTITVQVAGDTLLETTEPFNLVLSNPSSGAAINVASSMGLIQNDDGAILSIGTAPGLITEGQSGGTLVTLQVTRSGDTSIAAGANWTISSMPGPVPGAPLPLNGADFVGGLVPSGSVSFAPGQTSATISFEVAGDTLIEANEMFTVGLSAPTAGATLGGQSSVSLTLVNDDGAILAVSTTGLSLSEGNAGSTPFNFTITRSGDLGIAASANWAVTGMGASPNDFVGGVQPSGTVSFAPGETTQIVTVNVAGDTLVESGESFLFSLSNPSVGASLGTAASSSANILNDDGATGVFSIGPAPLPLTEGNAGNLPLSFTVNRTGDLSGAATVSWAVSGGTANAADFGGTLPSGSVNFIAGQSTATITVLVSGDTLVEPTENFSLTLTSVSPGATLGAPTTVFGTITNDDGAILATTNASGFSANEGNAGSTPFTITITRSGDLSITASADWAVVPATFPGANAPNAQDFAGGVLPSGSVSFGIGETSKTITVNFAGDTVFEPNEAFLVSLTNPSAGASIGNSVSYTITNDDGVVIAFAGQPTPSVFEGQGGGGTPMNFSVQRSGDVTVAASVNWAVTSLGTATASDFVGGVLPTGTLNFAPGETLKTITLNIAADGAVEPNETVTLQLSSPSSNATLGSFGSINGTISNDDPTSIAITATDADKAEGNAGTTTFTFTVTRSGDVSGTSSVNWGYNTNVSGSVTGAADFQGGVTPAGGTLNFAAGQTSQTITVQVVGDTTWENDERFVIALSNPVNAILTSATAIATIRNDEIPVDGTPLGDALTGGTTSELLRGFAGADTINGGAGDDTIEGGEGADNLTGGLGADRFVLPVDGFARSTLSSMDVVLDFNEAQLDLITLGGVNGTLTVNGVNRTFLYNGDTGIFLADAPVLGQRLPAQFHNIPTFQAFWLQDVDALGAPEARGWLVVDLDGDEVLGASDFIAEVRGALSGRDLNFPLYEFLSDVQWGTSFTPPSGTTGNDTITGTGRNEFFTGTTGSDVLNGGPAAFNTLSYSGFTTPINVTVNGVGSGTVVKNGGAQGTDSYTNFHSIITGSGADRFDTTGLTLATFYGGNLQGNAGNDTYIGGFSVQNDGTSFANAVVTYSGGSAAANINLETGVASDGLGGTDTLTNIRRLSLTSNFNDSVTGSAFTDQVSSSGNGNRNIDLGAGANDRWTMGSNTRDGTFGPPITRAEVELGTGISGGEFTGVARKYLFSGGAWTLTGTDILRGVEQAVGGIGADSLVGSDSNNAFFGGEGNDSIDGGLGVDLVFYDSFTGQSHLAEHGVTVNLTTGTAIDSWGFTDTLTSIESVYGTQQADDLTGVSVAATRTMLRGLTGNDILRAPALDTLVTADYRGDRGAVTVNLATGLATDGWGDTDRLVNIQSVIGSRFADQITGGARDDVMEGGAGDDVLTGGTGADIAIFTGARGDYLITRDSVTFALTIADKIAGRDGTDLLAMDIETLRFSDGDQAAAVFITPQTTFLAIAPLAADQAEGNTGTTAFTFTVTRTGLTSGTSSVAWSVTSALASGSDFQGGALPSGILEFAPDETTRTLTINVNGDTTPELDEAFTVTLSNPVAANLVTGTAQGVIRNDEVLIQGTPNNDTLTGGPAGESIQGLAGNDSLFGNAGDDTIEGGDGNDTLVGGDGDDSIDGGAGSDTILAGLGSDDFHGGTTGFRDTVSYASTIIGGPITVTMTDVANGSVTKPNGDVDSLSMITGIWGTAGNDSFLSSATIFAGFPTASLRIRPGAGNDTVDGAGAARTAVDYSDAVKAIHVDLSLNRASQDGFDGTDTLNNVRFVTTSGGFNDTIIGSNADERFGLGGAGNKLIDGGGGTDTYRNDASTGFVANLQTSLVGGVPTGTVIKASGTDTLISIENLVGGRGNDSITGSQFDNMLSGEFGADTVDGAGGFDTLDMSAMSTVFSIPARSIVNLSVGAITVGSQSVAAGTALDGFGFTDILLNIEGVIGTDLDDVMVGSDVANHLAGRSGNDSLAGEAGNDTLVGEAGDDTLGGGTGTDIAVFTGARSQYTITLDSGTGRITVTDNTAGRDGTDLLQADIETLRFSDADYAASSFGTVSLPVLSISALSADKAEGNSGTTPFTFTVTRTGDTTAASSAAWAVNSSGADAFDFAGTLLPSGTIDFAAGETSRTITVQVLTDSQVEADEDFTVTLSAPVNAALGTKSAQGLIRNDDALLSVTGGAPLAEGNSSTTPFAFTVTRSGDASTAVSANWAITGTGAQPASAADFIGGTLPSGVVNFFAGETTKTITVDVIGDTGLELNEEFTLTLSAPTAGAALGTAIASRIILNDDAILNLAGPAAPIGEGDAGLTPFTFSVTRIGDASGAASAQWAVTSTSADATDFAGGMLPTGTVSFAAGETVQTITVNVAGDTGFEADEVFTLTLSASTGASLGTALAQGTILNDDAAAVISLAPGFNGVPEGNAGTRFIHFAVNRSGDLDSAVSASWTVSAPLGSGITAADFQGGVLPSGTVSFAAGEVGKTITIAVAGDTLVEVDEAFTLTLSAPTGGATLGTSIVSGTIINDDAEPMLDIAALDADKAEGNAGTASFTFLVTRTGDNSGAASASWTVSGAADAADFAGGVLPGGTVSFAAGESSQTITIAVAGDASIEDDEGFTLTLSAPSGATLGFATASGVIRNDDTPVIVAPVLDIIAANADLAEGNAGPFPFTFAVTRTGGLSLASSVNWTVTGNGATASDFIGNVLPSGTVNFAAGESLQSITVMVAGDTTNEPNEGFTVTLSGASGATLGTATAAGLIRNDDASIFSVAPLTADRNEGNSGPTAFTFTVWREGNTSAAAGVTFTITGSGTDPASGADFNAGVLPSGTLTFAAGETSRTLSVNILGDLLFEPDETFTVTLSSTNPAVGFGTASAQGFIRNDDPLTVLGTAGPDTLIGTAANELLLGLGDNDLLDGGAGNDTVDAGAGNDTLLAGAGVDLFNGGAGVDTLLFGPAFAGVNLSLSLASGSVSLPDGPLSFTAIENVTGGAGNDVLIGDGAANALNGGAGNDSLTGGLGNDSLTGGLGVDRFEVDAGTDAVTDLGLGGAEVLVVNAGATANAALAAAWVATAASNVSGIAYLTANGFNADLSAAAPGLGLWSVTNTGNGTAVRFTGSVNADALTGGEGGDTLLGGASGDTLSGNGGTDSLAGGAGNDSLSGGAGNDTLLGEADDDSLTGGAGDDRMTGGAGVDRFAVDAGSDTITDLGLGGADLLVVSGGATANATLAANWVLTAGNSNGGTANITAAGFNADLTLAAGSAGWAVSNLGTNRAVSLTGSARNDTLTGGNGNDTLLGGGGNDSLLGDAGSDSLTGGAGNDTMTGGAAVDRFVVDAGTDAILDLGAGGNDVLVVSAGATANATLAGAWTASSNVSNAGVVNLTAAGFNVTLTAATGLGTWSVNHAGQAGAVVFAGSVQSDRLTGGLGADSLTGNAGDDTLTGGDGTDTLNGGAGTDSLVGGLGDDRLTGGTEVDRFLVEAGTDTITDLGFGGTDALVIQAGAAAVATIGGHWTASGGSSNAGSATVFAAGFNVNVASVSGVSGWALSNAGQSRGVSLVGSGNADSITGGSGADTLRGQGGADSLLGEGGNDQLFGGAGNDTMTGGAGIDRFTVDAGTDVITDLGAGGVDVVIVSAGATLQATLAADWTATAASSNAGVANLATAGFDVNLSAAAGSLGWNVSATTADAVLITGSRRADVLMGGAGADTLIGGAGNDTIIGGGGFDSLLGGLGDDRFLDAEGAQVYEGGAGLDRYAFLAGHGHDSIRDFTQGDDKIDLSGFAGIGFGDLQLTYGGAGTPSDPAYVVVSANGGVDSISVSLPIPVTLVATDFIFA